MDHNYNYDKVIIFFKKNNYTHINTVCIYNDNIFYNEQNINMSILNIIMYKKIIFIIFKSIYHLSCLLFKAFL